MQIIRTDFSAYFPADFAQQEQNYLKAAGFQKYATLQDDLELSAINDIVLITNTQTDFNKLPKSLLERTRLIVHPNSGYDNFGPEWVEAQAFPIVIGHQIRAQAVSEYILSCLMDALTGLPKHPRWDQQRQWPRSLLQDQNYLIIGYGHIGQNVESSLRGIGASHIQIFDPYKGHHQLSLNKVNVVIMACGLNQTSKHLIDAAFLEELPKGFTLINAARGGLIKTQDLLVKLKSDPEACAYLDVFENEPAQLEALADYQNLHCTSHIAGVYQGLNENILRFEAQVLSDFFKLNPQQFKQNYSQQILQNRLHKGFLI